MSLLPEAICTYYEVQDGTWQLRTYRGEFRNPAMIPALSKGLPRGVTVNLDHPFDTTTAYYQDVYNPATTAAAGHAVEVIRTSAAFPVFTGQTVRGVLVIGRHEPHPWTSEERTLLETVVRNLSLALERAHAAQQLLEQNAELEARTRALEAFVDLTRDLAQETDRYALIQCAQDVVLSLMPSGHATYYEPDTGTWRLKSRVGAFGHPDLERLVEAGLPFDVPTLHDPWTTGTDVYQDVYMQGSDTPAELVRHIQALVALNVRLRGQPIGIFVLALFAGHVWTQVERAVLNTVMQSLSASLERAEGVKELAERTVQLERINATLEHRTRELERSNQELEQFAYIASHDLQEPLRTVTSFSELLVRQLPDGNGKAAKYVQLIREGTQRMGRLLQDLLAFSRVVTQGQDFRRVDAQEVAGQVVQDLSAQIGRTHATMTISALPPVLADETQLRQLLQNLISNALKFGADARPPAVQVDATVIGEMVQFAVRDNGIGIEPQYYERIFTIFQRLNTREAYEGTGMGLAIARRIVERHGGQIWPESVFGVQTTIFFTLPRAE